MRTRKLNEAEFWKRYFQSKLFNAHRASIRSSATQHVVKDDPIFDKYLEKDDDGKSRSSVPVNENLKVIAELEPRNIRDERVDIFIDLGATLEDHREVMRPLFVPNVRSADLLPRLETKGMLPCKQGSNEQCYPLSASSTNILGGC